MPDPLQWTACGVPFQCATLAVPLDYAHLDGPRVGLALIRLPARDSAHRIGSLLTDPGGPGGSGVDFVRAAAQGLFAKLGDRFDIVGFDPRGAGRSDPIRCLDGTELENFLGLDPVPDDAAERQGLVDASKAYGAACTAHGAALLPYLGATFVARDMEEMRLALGDDQLTYLGLSYGTLLGATYADLFPDHVRAIALDGDVDPALGTVDFIRDQSIGLEDALNRFLAACARDAGCKLNRDGKGKQRYEAMVAAVDKQPLTAGHRKLRPGEVVYAMAEGLVSPRAWRGLADAISAAAGGDGTPMLDMADEYAQRRADGTYSNLFDVYNAVVCTDRPPPTQLGAYDRLAKELATSAPHFGPASVWEALPCATWPVPATGQAGALHAAGAPPILVVSATHDPATPHKWGKALASELSSGVLLTRDGDGHVSFGRTACVNDAIEAYLLELKTPPPGTVC